MYEKEFVPLTKNQISMVNASALSSKFECTSQYVSRILKSQKFPKSQKARKILKAARDIIVAYEKQSAQID